MRCPAGQQRARSYCHDGAAPGRGTPSDARSNRPARCASRGGPGSRARSDPQHVQYDRRPLVLARVHGELDRQPQRVLALGRHLRADVVQRRRLQLAGLGEQLFEEEERALGGFAAARELVRSARLLGPGPARCTLAARPSSPSDPPPAHRPHPLRTIGAPAHRLRDSVQVARIPRGRRIAYDTCASPARWGRARVRTPQGRHRPGFRLVRGRPRQPERSEPRLYFATL